MGQVIVEEYRSRSGTPPIVGTSVIFGSTEQTVHVGDKPRVPPLDVAVHGLGAKGVRQPRVHGGTNVGIIDGDET